MHPDEMTVREAARRLGVHENTIRRWCKQGLLAHRVLPHSDYRRPLREDVERIWRERMAPRRS